MSSRVGWGRLRVTAVRLFPQCKAKNWHAAVQIRVLNIDGSCAQGTVHVRRRGTRLEVDDWGADTPDLSFFGAVIRTEEESIIEAVRAVVATDA